MARAVGRMELFARLGRITVAETMVDEAFEYGADLAWRASHLESPHGKTWFTSMHVSSFPVNDPRACERKLAYGMMAFPSAEPMPQKPIAAGVIGSAVEEWVVDMLDLDGRLLSAGTGSQHQIGLEDADHWLTGSPDLIVLPPFWNRPLVIEKKTAYHDVVEAMRNLTRSYIPAHGRQCLGYIGLGHHLSPQLWPTVVVCKHTWRLAEEGSEPVIDAMVCRDHGINADSGCLIEIDLQPIRDGVVLYSSRDHAELRKSWYFEHDEAAFQKALEVLRRAQEYYANDVIPPHPFGGKQWSAEPCKFCDLKKNTCKPDHLAGVEKLSESHGVDWARGVYGEASYNPTKIRQAVLDRWKGQSGFNYTLPKGYKIGRNGVQKERANA
jgi:hypothetical protein